MKNKNIVLVKTSMRYIRDFSIVVAGIAVTLYVNNQVVYHGEKRDMHLYLNAVKIELEENVKYLESKVVALAKSVNYADYLNSNDKNSLNPDTIMSYAGGGWGNYMTISFQTTAFEMSKISGTLRHIEDKTLLLSIWDAYNLMNNMQLAFDRYYQLKMDEMQKLPQFQEIDPLKIIPMYGFYTNGNLPNEMYSQCKNTLDYMKKTIKQLEDTL